MLIYDDKINYKIAKEYEELIQNFLYINKDYSFNIVFTIKSYPYFSHSIAIKNQKKLQEQYEEVSNELKKMKKILILMSSKVDLNKLQNNNENEKILKEYINDLNKKNNSEADKIENQ